MASAFFLLCGVTAIFARGTELECSSVSTDETLQLEVRQCATNSGGSFGIKSTNQSYSIERSRFRGRIVGTIINSLNFHYHSDKWTAHYSLPIGNYTASIELRYIDFNAEYFEKPVKIEKLKRESILDYKFSIPSTRRCGTEASTVPGFWSGSDVHNLPAQMLASNIHDSKLFDNIFYSPSGCILDPMEDLLYWAKKQNSSRLPPKICLFGDSQSRSLSDMLNRLIWGIEVKFDAEVRGVAQGSQSIHYIADGMSGNASSYGFFDYEKLAGVKSLIKSIDCSFILLNYGQWQIGWIMGASQEKISNYRRTVQTALTNALAMKNSAPLYWLTMHPHGESDLVRFRHLKLNQIELK